MNYAYTEYAPLALFILAFCESVFFPVPADLLLILLVLASRAKAFRYALICTLGSVSGALVGYCVGHFAFVNSGGDFTWFANLVFQNIPGFSEDLFNNIKGLYTQWDFWIIFIAGFTPIPFKIFTVTGGVFDLNLAMFLLASVISRGARYFLLSFLLWKYGSPIKLFFEKYFNLLALGFTASLVCAIVFIKYVI